MGAQESVARSKDEVLQIGEEYSKKSGAYRLWTHVNPCTKNKKIKGTIFTRESLSADERGYFENGIKMLKQLRHPGVVTFLEASSTATSISLMTERVQILDLCIDSLSSVEIHSGLRQILEVLIFLHERAAISHNSVCPSSIFVTQSGEWKLGSFEMAQSFKTTRHVVQSQFYRKTRTDGFAPPDSDSRESGETWRDSFALGRLIDYACEFIDDKEMGVESIELLRAAASSLSSSTTPPSLRTLIPSFNNNLTTILDFLESIHLKSEEEKEEFFNQLSDRLHSLPARVVSRRLCRLAISRYVLLEPRSHTKLYPLLLTPKTECSTASSSEGLLPLELYRNHVIPEVVRVFRVRDTSVRLGLLAHFERYAPYVPLSQLEGFVLDEVIFSSQDVDDRLVSASLRAMSSLVSLLGASRVCPWKLEKNFVDGTPKPSTNTPSRTAAIIGPPAPPRAVIHLEDEEESIPEYPAPQYAATAGLDATISRHRDTIDEEEEVGEMEQIIHGTQSNDVSTWNDDNDWTSDWEREHDESRDADKQSAREEEGEIPKTVERLPLRTVPLPPKKAALVPEYEIPAVRSFEDDFFADMQPEIKTSGSIIDRLIEAKRVQEQERAAEEERNEEKQSRSKVIPPPSTSKFSLSMDDSALDDTTTGWAEEENDVMWGEEEETEEGGHEREQEDEEDHAAEVKKVLSDHTLPMSPTVSAAVLLKSDVISGDIVDDDHSISSSSPQLLVATALESSS